MEAVDYVRLQGSLQSASQEIGYGLSEGNIATLRVCFHLLQYIII